MNPSLPEPPRRLATLAVFVIAGALFAVACWQAPLYYSNQNQYFLHGLAHVEGPPLSEDWLANMLDSTPLFTGLVEVTVRYLPAWTFHLQYALIQGLYAASLLGLFWLIAGERARRRWPLFLALLLALHAALPRWASYRWLGQDYPWYFQAGVAGQYVLGAMFQPSTFGVLLLVAVWLFARGNSYVASAVAALAASFHFTYLLPAGMVVLGFQIALVAERRYRRALLVGVLALVLVVPVCVYVLHTFGPTSPETFAEAQAILVNFRIPHHTRVDLWLDLVAALQIVWALLGIALARPARLRLALAVAAGLAVLLTAVQFVTRSDTLALLFPWRISAVLVPLATGILLSRLVAALPAAVEGTNAKLASAVVVLLCVAGSAWIGLTRQGFRTSDEELPLLDFVRRTRLPGDVYFLPVNVPPLAKTTRGSGSSDFKPLAEKKQGVQTIPFDLQRFRSIPYKDTEVLEWYTRIRLALDVQAKLREGSTSEALAVLRSRGVTHLVLPAAQALPEGVADAVYADEHYRVYRLEGG
jgi:hypothetical protein